jgi:uncharacterized protein with PIN domain
MRLAQLIESQTGTVSEKPIANPENRTAPAVAERSRLPEARTSLVRLLHAASAGCERIYWQGSHWARMHEMLRVALAPAPAAA